MNNRASNDEVSEAELAQLLLEYIQQPDLHTTQRVNADNIDPRYVSLCATFYMNLTSPSAI